MNRNIRPTNRARTTTPSNAIDLASLFNVATQALAANKTSLNQADTYNKNHGDNMVQAFNLITQVMAANRSKSPSQQLTAASQTLAKKGNSGSTVVYAQGLAQAARQLRGQKAVTPDNAMTLIQALFGGEQQQQSTQGADLLGSLLGGGTQQQPSSAGADLLGSLLGGGTQQQPSSAGADLLGSLLGGGQTPNTSANDGQIDVNDLLTAGMAFLQAKQAGATNMQAFIQALVANGPMGNSTHRTQSGQLVASALIQALAGMAAKKK